MNPPDRSAIYVGWLRHRRRTPVVHEFSYPLFMVMLNVDSVSAQMQRSRLTSYNRWNWASFWESDHLAGYDGSLRDRLAADAAARGLAPADGPVYLLTHLRYLGYGFNPVSFFYCFDRADRLQRVMAEVNNTSGGTHHYWLTPDRDDRPVSEASVFTASAQKAFPVSPFLGPRLSYDFALTPPGQRLVAHITATDTDAETPILDATLSMNRRPWTPREVRRALMQYPARTASVIAAIHWQAVRLWWKGVPVVTHLAGDQPRHVAGRR